MLPDLSRRLRAGDTTGGRGSFNRGIEFALTLTLPAAVALMAIALPLTKVLYERGAFSATDSQNTALVLAIYGAGLPSFVLHKVLQPLFYAREDTKSPFRYAVVSMILNLLIAVGLMPYIGFAAAAFATTLAGWIMLAQRWIGSRRMGDEARLDDRLRNRLPRIVLASAPVSYTHLDVYKRQHMLSLTGSAGITRLASGASGAIRSARRESPAICANTGAATSPP